MGRHNRLTIRPWTRTAGVPIAVVLAAAGLAVAGPGAASLAAASPAASRAPLAAWAQATHTYVGSAALRGVPESPAQAFMNGVAALSSNDIWAVGTTGGMAAAAAAEHWNGTTWSVVTVPAPPDTVKSFLNSVAAVSTNDVWAVGTEYPVSSDPAAQLPLIEHWNGSAWSIVTSPSLGPDYNQLNGVTAVSANNVWAVGNTSKTGSRIVTEIDHWNGTSWSIVPSPNVKGANANQLNQLSVVSANNIWAVGYSAILQERLYVTLAEHWNGTSWSVVTTPTSSSTNYDLQGAAPLSPSASDVWAVGSILNKSGQTFHTLSEHWNGTAWERVPIPSAPGSRESVLFNAAELASNNVWAVGWNVVGGGNDEAPLMEHWNGTKWSLVSTPTVANAAYYDLFSLAAISADDIWAVGSATLNTGVSYPLFEHWNGTAWKIVSGG